ncbi:Uncharacterised protein [Klebsiella pneumoniae]|nr:Uncharacterised protein [Klebsiella pneumoniae]
MDVLLTAIAPAFSLLFGDMQFAPLASVPRQTSSKQKVRALASTQENAPTLSHTPVTRRAPACCACCFNNFQRPLAEGDFVHSRLRIAMRLLCNNDARMKSS